MIEGVLSWAMLICGMFTKDPLYFIACGVFAIAAQIWMVRESKK